MSGDALNALRTPYYGAHGSEIQLNDGAFELLQFCSHAGMQNAMVSASPEDVVSMLKQFEVLQFFEKITLCGRKKDEALVETLDHFGVKAEDAFYIDDTFSGLSSALNIGMGAIGFTDGYNSETRIRAAKPDFMVHSLHDVIPILVGQQG